MVIQNKKPATSKGPARLVAGLVGLSTLFSLGAAACKQPTDNTDSEVKQDLTKEYSFPFGTAYQMKIIDKTGTVNPEFLEWGMTYLIEPFLLDKYKALDGMTIIIDNYANKDVVINNLPKVEGKTVYAARSKFNSKYDTFNVICWIVSEIYDNHLITLGKQYSNAKQIVRAAFRPAKQMI